MTDNYFTTPTREEEDLSRRIRRRDLIEFLATLVALILFVALCIVCYAATPVQMSAECDLAIEMMENMK